MENLLHKMIESAVYPWDDRLENLLHKMIEYTVYPWMVGWSDRRMEIFSTG